MCHMHLLPSKPDSDREKSQCAHNYFTYYCINRNYREFGTDILRVFIFVIVQMELHIVEPIGPMSKLTIVTIHQSSTHFPA